MTLRLPVALSIALAACSHSAAPPATTDAGCSIDLHGGPLTQTAARLGAYYFDGWSGGINDYHLHQITNGPDGPTRQPLSGWEDNTACEVEQQLAWARSYGLSYFIFDWFYPPSLNSCYSACWYLNSALNNYLKLSNRHGMGFAVLYVDQGPSVIAPADWPDAVSQWVTLFTDPDYVRVNGRPLFMVIDLYNMYQAFGSSHASVAAAFKALRTAAQQKGLPDVYIVGGFGIFNGATGQDDKFYDLASYEGEGYDAFSMYSYGNAPTGDAGPQPFSLLSDTAQWIWAQTPRHTSLPSIPVATIGWDTRPEGFQEPPTNFPPIWINTSAQDADGLVRSAVDWAEAHPTSRPEPSPAPPLVFIDAWNELLEGSYLVPTVARQHSFGDAIRADMARGPDKPRVALQLQATARDAGPPWLAYGTLLDEAGHAVAGGVAIDVQPLDGAGVVSAHATSGIVPAGAATAYVLAEANMDGYGPGPASVTLYSADFRQPGDSASRVANSDFSQGATGWSFVGAAAYAPHGALDGGVAVQLSADAGEQAWAGSAKFAVTADAGFSATFVGRVAPASTNNGAWFVAFFGAGGSYVSGAHIIFHQGTFTAGTAVTDGGVFSVDLGSLGSGSLEIDAYYDGGTAYWPASARLVR
jgi:hypothetical protein